MAIEYHISGTKKAIDKRNGNRRLGVSQAPQEDDAIKSGECQDK